MVYIDALGTITDEALSEFNREDGILGFKIIWDNLNDKGKTSLRQYAANENADISDYELDEMWLIIYASDDLDSLSIYLWVGHKESSRKDIGLSPDITKDEFKSILDAAIIPLCFQLYDLWAAKKH